MPSGRIELERPERAFVRHLVGADQILEGDPRGGLAAAVIAGIDAAFDLIGDLGIIDRHLVAGDDDLHRDRQRLVAFAVVVEKGLVAVDAVRHRADQGARRRLALVENGLHRARERVDAVFVGER